MLAMIRSRFMPLVQDMMLRRAVNAVPEREGAQVVERKAAMFAEVGHKVKFPPFYHFPGDRQDLSNFQRGWTQRQCLMNSDPLKSNHGHFPLVPYQ